MNFIVIAKNKRNYLLNSTITDIKIVAFKATLTPPLPGCWPIRGLPGGGGQIDPPLFFWSNSCSDKKKLKIAFKIKVI